MLNLCTPAVTESASDPLSSSSTEASSDSTAQAKGKDTGATKAAADKKPFKKRETKPKPEGAETKPKAKPRAKAPETVRKSETRRFAPACIAPLASLSCTRPCPLFRSNCIPL